VTRSRLGSVFRVPAQESGTVATCWVCYFSRFFPNRKRKKGSSFSRASRVLVGHWRKKHPEMGLKVWVPE
jgi:hypothetical protein